MAVYGAGAGLLYGLFVGGCAVAFVFGESILGVLGVECVHDAVT